MGNRIFKRALVALLCLGCAPAFGTRIKDLCEIQGARGNMLIGTGIVVGLAGTGDKNTAALVAQERALERLGITVESVKDLKSDNCAIVMVTAELPAFAKEGTRIDIEVESLYNCKSLEGGTLMETYLTGPGGEATVYAVAQGAVSIGGFNASGGGSSVSKNHSTAGRIPMGAYVEREAPSTITDGERIGLLLKMPDFATANNIQQAINEKMEVGSAEAFGAGTISVKIPKEWRRDLVAFIASVQDIDVKSDGVSRVVINERTGTLVVGDKVMIKPCQVAHGNLTIKMTTKPLVSQPGAFSSGQTVATQTTKIDVSEEGGHYLSPVSGTSAGEVAAALNKIKVSPRDMISIFQALRKAGALEADLEVM